MPTGLKTTRTDDPHRTLRVALLVAGIVALIASHAAVLGYKKYADVDEAYASSIAERLLEGFKLYDGAVSQRGPLMYYGFALIAKVTGWDNVLGLRVWALGFCIAHVLLVYWAGRVLVSRWAGLVAALLTVYALAFGFPARDAMALHGEAMQIPALIGCAVTGAFAMRGSPRRKWLAISGLLLGVAICIKQSVALHVLPMLVWIAIDARKQRAGAWGALGDASTFVAATLALPAVFLLNALREGTLSQLVYYCFTYNLQVHLQPTARAMLWLGPLHDRMNERTFFFVALVVLAARAAPFALRRVRASAAARSLTPLVRAFGVRGYLGLHLVVALVTASSMYRFFPHYYLQAMPFLTVLLGASLRGAFVARTTGRIARSTIAGFTAFLLAYAAITAYFLEKVDGRIAHEPVVERLARYVEASTAPEQRVFVWGFSPWLYPYSHRKPAGRFVFETYVTGFVPWFWEEPDVERKRIVPGSMEALLGDLDREKPEIVIDAGSVLFGRSMRAYELSSRWLHDRYCFELRFGAFDVYRRKPDDASCQVPYFPRIAFPVDFYGRPAPFVVMPITVDQASSRWLPPNEYDKATQFAQQTPPPHVDMLRDPKREREAAEGLKKLGVEDARELLPPAPCEDSKR